MKFTFLDIDEIENAYKKNYALLFTSEPKMRLYNTQYFG